MSGYLETETGFEYLLGVLADSGVSAFRTLAPQGTPYPYAVVSFVAEAPAETVGRVCGATELRYQIVCWGRGNSTAAAADMAADVFAALTESDLPASVGNWSVIGVYRDVSLSLSVVEGDAVFEGIGGEYIVVMHD